MAIKDPPQKKNNNNLSVVVVVPVCVFCSSVVGSTSTATPNSRVRVRR